ncbi:MAG: DUF1700 domain-containing protein [Coriobacteriales bacterium]|jgi:uncharacterized membrane protein|nr:DUF1700 domain-containing protein [Coriobacteriales bacterium]
MNKEEFLARLTAALGRLPQGEIEQSISFYREMIDDRIEDGMSEADAIASLGDIEQIAAQIIAETPLVPKALAKAKTGSRTLNIVLVAVFSPVWVPVALALAASAFAVYISIWAVIVSLWAVVFSLLLTGVVGIAMLAYLVVTGHALSGVFTAGAGLVCVGIGLFCYYGVAAASKGLFALTKRFAAWVQSLFIHREARHEQG